MNFGTWTRLRVAVAGLIAATAVGALVLALPAQAAPEHAVPAAVPTATAAASSTLSRIVRYASAIEHGARESGWHGGALPYSWGGGHASRPGPSLGTCAGYTGRIHPCPATHTTGVDCSGLTRWVYALAFGRDVFGSGNTNDQVQNGHLHRTSHPKPGDLVFYGSSTSNTHHVGIYVGNGRMINALYTGSNVETDSVQAASGLLGYYHYS